MRSPIIALIAFFGLPSISLVFPRLNCSFHSQLILSPCSKQTKAVHYEHLTCTQPNCRFDSKIASSHCNKQGPKMNNCYNNSSKKTEQRGRAMV
ncbi:MAG: hypothetical protein J3R72DRAFT_446956 [Linnemannia gamsii]|nr:MAG: hypothetical protein J3R72DRAFT_446956 [Linnemannia gamsii]